MPLKRLICSYLLLWSAVGATATPPPELRAKLEAIAGAEVDKVRYFRLMFWQALDDRSLILWLGREEPYLVDLREHCHNLAHEISISLTNYVRPGRNTVRARWDFVQTRDRRCRIGTIRPLDLEGMTELGMDLPSMRANRRAEEDSDAPADR